jgi:hypothetical protein
MDKRLVSTSIGKSAKLGSIFSSPPSSLPELNQKTMSGNYAVFSQALVRQLLRSSKALKVFALSKYGCCGTHLDNYNWMAALHSLSTSDSDLDRNEILKEAKINTAMFQLWGGFKGDTNCEKALRQESTADNAILTVDPSTCYRIEHPLVANAISKQNVSFDTDWTIPEKKLSFHGGKELMEHIRFARQSGFLFARQFDSKNPQSMAVLEAIEKEWL